jgi:N-acetylglucosamine-6-phosphate deacetylase
MAALGAGPGRYRLNDLTVTVTEQGARLDDGTLAGSVLSLDAALRNLLAWTGCDLAALATVTTTPARLLGLAGERGRIAPGCVADLVVLTPALEVVMTIAAGEIVYRGAGAPC